MRTYNYDEYVKMIRELNDEMGTKYGQIAGVENHYKLAVKTAEKACNIFSSFFIAFAEENRMTEEQFTHLRREYDLLQGKLMPHIVYYASRKIDEEN